ncbi:MAG: hypothetical protein EOR30_31970 [Mesorhizobium sp.]|uniref:hypothetical protein n=1 Tax=Mesorhizobium sp. TaxID=1871066 RepID=UPI000FE81E80|nr:hypothetical protein [Mesorhizobium sp.]RWI33323.1 MAG: hypothetical protein EOR14_33300 [Mesorhizobium sp.]RWI37047.1 MAG: hypothetical protein EOR14_25895 [Mesorhizobium sp.]RWI62649.1 MAG: hypothetical protein EOR17_32205 [Mesorhizobium sp.]RWI81472.1 MAG: hypothetical protein EOR20_32620 [Mesorhizobium sp.]RWJ42369.1 MAG: hypothetical protein EOR30_31970 [Mesorhizobium sp.]
MVLSGADRIAAGEPPIQPTSASLSIQPHRRPFLASEMSFSASQSTLGEFFGGFAKSVFGAFHPVYLSVPVVSLGLVVLTLFLKREEVSSNAAGTPSPATAA